MELTEVEKCNATRPMGQGPADVCVKAKGHYPEDPWHRSAAWGGTAIEWRPEESRVVEVPRDE